MHFTLADLVADIAQNGAESGACRMELDLEERLNDSGGGEFRFCLRDNGKGMDQEELRRAQDPFVTDGKKHPHRKVGLGLPFLIQTAESSGGGWSMESKKRDESGGGTLVRAWFDLGNVDTPPAGDLPGLFRTVLLFEGPVELHIRRVREKGGRREEYTLCKTELEDALGGLEDAQSLVLLDQYLRSLEAFDDEQGSGDEDTETHDT